MFHLFFQYWPVNSFLIMMHYLSLTTSFFNNDPLPLQFSLPSPFFQWGWDCKTPALPRTRGLHCTWPLGSPLQKNQNKQDLQMRSKLRFSDSKKEEKFLYVTYCIDLKIGTRPHHFWNRPQKRHLTPSFLEKKYNHKSRKYHSAVWKTLSLYFLLLDYCTKPRPYRICTQ